MFIFRLENENYVGLDIETRIESLFQWIIGHGSTSVNIYRIHPFPLHLKKKTPDKRNLW